MLPFSQSFALAFTRLLSWLPWTGGFKAERNSEWVG